MNEEEKIKMINDYNSVTFVRHPFVRLVSTFKDKVIDHPYKHWRFSLGYKANKIHEVSKYCTAQGFSFVLKVR